MATHYRSPAQGPAAAVAALGRLAREVEGDALWRQASDGTLEVARLRDGAIERYSVDEAGQATLVDARRATSWQRSAKRVSIGAWALALLSIVALGITSPDGQAPPVLPIVLFFVGVALFGIGGFASARSEDVAARLKTLGEDPREWQRPTNLGDWTPRSAEQVRAVEGIAEAHGGLAFVVPGSRAVDVYTVHKGMAERFWVDERGSVHHVDARPPTRAYVIERVLTTVFGALVVGVVAVLVLVDRHKGPILLGLGVGIVLTMIGAWLNGRAENPVRRLDEFGVGPHNATVIRTRIEDTD